LANPSHPEVARCYKPFLYPVVFALGNPAKGPNRDRNMALISTEDDEETDNLQDLKQSLKVDGNEKRGGSERRQ
jgi:hypothetical protein